MLMCLANKLTMTRVLYGQDKRETFRRLASVLKFLTEMSSPYTKFLHYNVMQEEILYIVRHIKSIHNIV